ncbi:phage minor head protein [Campylobacter mucosalis]|uniref:phage head morphogenesis protein n=1 Tax=Campylobacter mucosalis TaxID=202 RepID=UPI0014706CAF|nr:phage minor head protein [Campylobacter mucosalis]
MKQTLGQKFKNRRLKLLAEPTPSKRAEVKYRNSLLVLIKSLKDSLQTKIKEFMANNPTATQAEIFNYITTLIESLRKTEILTFAGAVCAGMVKLVNIQNQKQIISGLTSKPSNELINLTQAVSKDKLDEYIAKNVSLINSIKQELLTDIESAVRKNYLESGHVKNLSSLIEQRASVSKNRARLIARDQTAKLNADLTKERQQGLGINCYIWRTNQDERVRKTHANMNNILCRYDDDTVFSDDGGRTWKKRTTQMPKGKPGDEIQCRCRARGVILDEL